MAEPVRCTPNHITWSVDRKDFVQARNLNAGNLVLCDDGVRPIIRVETITEPIRVFNLEVQGQHVYQVSSLGMLVHNACPWSRWGVGEHALQASHNWSKVLGSQKPTLTAIRPFLDDVLANGSWTKVGDATGRGGRVIGEILQAEHNGIWVRAFRDAAGEIIVNNGGVL